jgi:hypothetical protein
VEEEEEEEVDDVEAPAPPSLMDDPVDTPSARRTSSSSPPRQLPGDVFGEVLAGFNRLDATGGGAGAGPCATSTPAFTTQVRREEKMSHSFFF